MPLITPRRRFLITAPLALLLPAGLLTYLGLKVVGGVEARYRDQVEEVKKEIEYSVRNRSTDNIQGLIVNFQTLFESQILPNLPLESELEDFTFQINSPTPYARTLFIYLPNEILVFYGRQIDPETEDEIWAPIKNVPNSFVKTLLSAIDTDIESTPSLKTRTFHYVTYPEDIYATETSRELASYEIKQIQLEKDTADEPLQQTVVYGLTFDFDFINNTFFPQLLEDMWTRERELKYPIAIEDRYLLEIIAQTSSGGFVQFDESKKFTPVTFNERFPWYYLHFSSPTGEDIMDIARYEKIVYYCLIAAANVIMIVGVIGALRNIAQELAISDLRSDFVARVSHELRTPLGLIRLYAETLEMGRTKDEEKQKEYLRSIIKESERLTQLINNILNFSQMEAETKYYSFSETQIEDVIYESVESMRYHLERHGFEVHVHFQDDLPPISCDPEAIKQAIYNLLSNAMKYSGDGKYIAVNVYGMDSEIIVDVVDKGIGIALDQQKKIFQEFYRVEDPRVRETGGSGLGLAVVKHIVESHGGYLQVQSELGRGSVFSIHLPRQRPLVA